MKGEGYYGNRETGESRISESGVMSCAHCSKTLFLHPVPGQVCWKDDGGWCRSEMKPLCPACADRALLHGCEPALKQIESYGEALVKYDQYLKLSGLEPAEPKSLILPG